MPARKDITAVPSEALPPTFDTPSSRYIRSELDNHPGLSGFRLLTNNTNALMSRIVLADHAVHSIDMQYYIFENDATGRLVAQRLVAAADRGVRVRMLLDDIHVSDDSGLFELLDAHPNIEVRVFNPFPTRNTPAILKAMQFLMEWRRLNRRMHNKSFIVDNTAAVIGGRNIGDAYFDAAREDSNFSDLDLISIGPVVAEASKSFDNYWNSDAAYPISAFSKKRPSEQELAHAKQELAHDARAFAQSDYAADLFETLPNGATADRRGGWYWGSATLVADEPAKIEMEKDDKALRMGPKVKELIDEAKEQLLLISPYFIPGKSGVKYITGIAGRGVETKVLTNSLAATDEPAAYAGYSKYRAALLKGNVQMYELRPAPGEKKPSVRGTSSGVSLHAKAVVVDSREVFVGSMNMDQRSKLLNTEMGLIVDCPELAKAVKQFFDKVIDPESSFHVELKPEEHSRGLQTIWSWTDHGKTETSDTDPGVSKGRRLEVTLLGLLPIEGLL